MMKENKIDKLFKAKVSEGPFAFEEKHWVAAEKMLDAQPRGGGFRFGLMSGLVVVALSVASALWWMNTNQIETTDILIENQVNTEATNVEDQNTSLAPDNPDHFTNTLITQQNTSTETTEPTQELIDQEMLDNGETLNAELDDAQPEHETTKHDPKTAPVMISESEKQMDESSTSQKEEILSGTEQTSEERQTDLAHNNETHEDNPILAKDRPTNMTGASSSVGTDLTNVSGEEQAEIVPSVDEEIISAVKAENTVENSENASENSETGETETTSNESEEDIEPFKWTDNFTYNVGGEFGYYFNQRQLSASTNSEAFRNDHEAQNGSFTGGLSFQLGYRNWTLNTGVFRYSIREDVQYPTALDVLKGVDNSFWDVNEKWSYTVDSSWVIDTIYVGHWQADTNWSVQYDSSFVEQWDSTMVKEENPELAKNNGIKTISYAEVPVIFGRSFKMNKLVLDLQAGMSFGFLTKVEGAQYINQSVTNLATENQVDQFNRVVYSGILRVGLRYGLTQNLEAGIYPSLRYTFNSVLKPDYGEQRYLGYGLQFGLYYRL